MYQNMTREEMIQRLYEGNFTTGELERQLIAKLFEQCCGGGGSSAGGEAFVVNVSHSDSEDTFTMDKTAKEIWEAAQSSTILVKLPADEGVQDVIVMVDAKKDSNTSGYMFVVASMRFMADGDDVYPHVGGGGGDHGDAD